MYGGGILSGIHLDLLVADFVYPETKINAGTILGGLKLIVPRNVRVETREVACRTRHAVSHSVWRHP